MTHLRIILPALFACIPAMASAQVSVEETRLEVAAKATIDKQQVALSGVLSLTLQVEGPAPLEVQPPPLLLTPASLQLWKVQIVDSPTLTDLGMGRRRWQQDYRIHPYVPGKTVGMSLAPLKVRFGQAQEVSITWTNSLTVEVTKSVEQADPSLLHSITGVEEPPPNIDEGRGRRWTFMAIVLASTVIMILVVVLLIWRTAATAPPVMFDAPWAIRELEKLMPSSTYDSRSFNQMADILRRYLQNRLSIPVARFSTPELAASMNGLDSMSPETKRECRSILERCDVAKFASSGRDDSDDLSEWIARARQLITQIETCPQAEVPTPSAS